MTTSREAATPFDRPTLHLVIVDDDQEHWTPLLKESFKTYVTTWPLYDNDLFSYELHLCRSEKGFKDTTTRLLSKNAIVYAAVDLLLPRTDTDDVVDCKLWKNLILWCIEIIKENSSEPKTFDFCVMSQDASAIAELYSDDAYVKDLKRSDIKRIKKSEVLPLRDPNLKLKELWDDVRNFIRSHVKACPIPDAGIGSETSKLIWFGNHPKLSELRFQADTISKKNQGLYLLFSDSTGYEEDWFELVCHLRGTQPDDTKQLSVNEFKQREQLAWQKTLSDPPEVLLISHIENAAEKGMDLEAIFRNSDFFDRIKDGRKNLTFIQFPYLASEQTLRLQFDPEERDFLDLCLEKLGAPTSETLDTGFSYTKNSKILAFPSHQELKESGVIQRIIEFETAQWQQLQDQHGRELYPGIATVLREIPWEDKNRELHDLRMCIRYAYRRAAKEGTRDGGKWVREHHFQRDIQKILRGVEGFLIRGRWLFDRLSKKRTTHLSEDPALEKLQNLEEVYNLYDELNHLVELKRELTQKKKTTTSPDFPGRHFDALRGAYNFLNLVFATRDYLRERIKEFRKVAEDPSRHEELEDAYPSLRERPNWRELVEQMRFVWPYDMFPLPTSVSDYLHHSGVIAEFNPDFPAILRRHPTIQAEWQELNQKRQHLKEVLQDRESQYWGARRYVREFDSQPACSLLVKGEFSNTPLPTAFEMTFRSLLFFNAYVAICENHYIYGGSFLDAKDIYDTVKKPELFTAAKLLNQYISHLQDAHKIGESVFTRWRNEWPKLGDHRDAVRVAAHITRWLVKNGTLTDSDIEALAPLRKLESGDVYCPIHCLFDLFRTIRNRQGTKLPAIRIWNEQVENLWDLLRRFVAATTHPDLRIGCVSDDASAPSFWNRRRIHCRHLPDGTLKLPGRLSVFYSTNGKSQHFPIDDLVRVNPEDSSVWGVFDRFELWCNLTSFEEAGCKGGPDKPWLPLKEEFLQSEIWEATSGGNHVS